MKTLTRLSARALTYYISVKRWQNDLDFIDTEARFFTQFTNHLALTLHRTVSVDQAYINEKMMGLMSEKDKILQLLKGQLLNLENLAEDLVSEDKDFLTEKQAHLEFEINDLMSEFKEIKKKYFNVISGMIEPIGG